MFLNFINSPLSLFLDSLIAVPLTTTYIAIFIPNLSCDFWTLMFSHLQEILCYTSTRCQILLNLLVQRQLAVSCCCCCSVTQSCLTLCDPLDCSMPGFPVHHKLLELAQTHTLSHWCHPTISSSVVLFSSCLQSFPASGSFPMSQFLTSGSQSIGVSASVSVLSMNIQDWFPLGLTGWISLQSKGFSRVFFNTTVQKHQFFGPQLSL